MVSGTKGRADKKFNCVAVLCGGLIRRSPCNPSRGRGRRATIGPSDGVGSPVDGGP
jgi:hypothetical protein